MKILFCRSNPIHPDPRVEKEAKALVRVGHSVEVIAWDRTADLPDKELRDGYTINRLPIRASYAQGLGNIFPLSRWLVGLTNTLFRRRTNFDIIHACDFDTVLPALLCKWLFGKKVIYDIFDFYADHLRKTPKWMLRMVRKLDLWAVGQADAVIIVDESRREQVFPGEPKHLAVIYNSPEDVNIEVKPSSNERTASELRIVYVGLLQVERGLFELLHVLKCNPTWSLDIAGFGGDEQKIRKTASKLPNVYWHGRIPYQQTLEVTARCDVSVATYDPAIKNHRYASPNKLFEAMMFAKPMIVARDTNMDRIVGKWECGLIVEYGREGQLEAALKKLDEDPELRRKLGENGRRAYEEQFAWEKMRGRLYEVYQAVIEDKE